MGLFGRKKGEPQVIDLRETVEAKVVRGPILEFGFPTRCPECGGRGYLDRVDIRHRTQFEHCPSCFARWERSEEEILALNA